MTGEVTSSGRRHAPPALLVPLVVGALGVVCGDLGTSPLYSIREAFEGSSIALPSTEST